MLADTSFALSTYSADMGGEAWTWHLPTTLLRQVGTNGFALSSCLGEAGEHGWWQHSSTPWLGLARTNEHAPSL